MIALLIITVVFLLLYAACMEYYRHGWVQLPENQSLQHPPTTGVTILIAARNEEANLPALLTSIGRQSYPMNLLEVLVIDDHSTDATAEIAGSYPFVQVLNLADYLTEPITAYKKKALETGMLHSRGELIITTDADCVVPEQWVEHIVAFYEQHACAMVVMPVIYQPPSTPLDVFQTLDFMSLQGITGAAIHLGLHPMGNGANLAFSRRAFFEVNGYAGIDHKASGDDILLIQKMDQAFPNGIAYLKSKEVIVETQPAPDCLSFFRQRIRWASKSSAYQKEAMFIVMLLVYLLNVLLLVLPIMAVFSKHPAFFLISWVVMIAIKTLAELRLMMPVARFFNRSKWLRYFPLAQPFHIVYTVISGALGLRGTYTWKERKVQ
jgi:cellulose synthase/poly-beta-1,6-N-acetylglucosamine synthase-like glycosyltransferase